MITLTNWSFVYNNWNGRFRDPFMNEFVAPFSPSSCLHGRVENHPKIEDGHRVHTSIVVRRHPGHVLETSSGTLYRLLDPNPDYSLWSKTNSLQELLEGLK